MNVLEKRGHRGQRRSRPRVYRPIERQFFRNFRECSQNLSQPDLAVDIRGPVQRHQSVTLFRDKPAPDVRAKRLSSWFRRDYQVPDHVNPLRRDLFTQQIGPSTLFRQQKQVRNGIGRPPARGGQLLHRSRGRALRGVIREGHSDV